MQHNNFVVASLFLECQKSKSMAFCALFKYINIFVTLERYTVQ